MIVRQLKYEDKYLLEELIAETEMSLTDKHFWLPIDEESREHFFDENWTYWIGCFDGKTLVGASALFFNAHEYGGSASAVELDLDRYKVAEIGRLMVKPSYRGRGISIILVESLQKKAIEFETDYLIATAHPNNISQKTLKQIKMANVGYCVKCEEYERDILLKKISTKG